jgi:starch synthase (maltosyl-transferring)
MSNPDLLDGALLVEEAAQRAVGEARERLLSFCERLRTRQARRRGRYGQAMDPALTTAHGRAPGQISGHPVSRANSRSGSTRQRGSSAPGTSSFPRSIFADPVQTDGTLLSMEKLLPEIARMGFDVVYLPPIHPIGTTNRKGQEQRARVPSPGNPAAHGPSAPWTEAIKPCTPELGTIEDFPPSGPSRLAPRAGCGPGHRLPMLPGPSLGSRSASGMVPP